PATPDTFPLSLHDALPISIAGHSATCAIPALPGAQKSSRPREAFLRKAQASACSRPPDPMIKILKFLRNDCASMPGHGLSLTRKDRKSTRLNSSHVAISYA